MGVFSDVSSNENVMDTPVADHIWMGLAKTVKDYSGPKNIPTNACEFNTSSHFSRLSFYHAWQPFWLASRPNTTATHMDEKPLPVHSMLTSF